MSLAELGMIIDYYATEFLRNRNFAKNTMCNHRRKPSGQTGEEGFAGAREVNEEGEEVALVGVGEAFDVVWDEEGAGAGEGVDEAARALGSLGYTWPTIKQKTPLPLGRTAGFTALKRRTG